MTDRRQEVGFALALLFALAAGFGLELGFRAYKDDGAEPSIDWVKMVDTLGTIDPETQRAKFAAGESFGGIRFNSFGLRGPDVPMPKPSNLVRIALLGDSKVMSAEYGEEQSLSGQVVAKLAERVPQCRFDYVTMAGPGYTLPFLARIWSEVAPATKPDLAVVLAGTLDEMMATTFPPDRGSSGGQNLLDAFLARSWLLAAAQRHLFALSLRLAPPVAPSLDIETMTATHRANFAPLVEALGETPVLALGYRGRLRKTQPPEDQARFARDLQLKHPGLSVADAVALTELNTAELARLAEEAGWQFGDPIADLPYGDSHFLSTHHLTADGLSDLAARVVALLAPHVAPDCSILRDARLGAPIRR